MQSGWRGAPRFSLQCIPRWGGRKTDIGLHLPRQNCSLRQLTHTAAKLMTYLTGEKQWGDPQITPLPSTPASVSVTPAQGFCVQLGDKEPWLWQDFSAWLSTAEASLSLYLLPWASGGFWVHTHSCSQPQVSPVFSPVNFTSLNPIWRQEGALESALLQLPMSHHVQCCTCGSTQIS